MKYYKYKDEYSDIAPGTEYLETDDGVTFRQIAFNGKEYLASNRKNPYYGLGIAEGRIDFDSIEEVTPITKQEFEKVWNAHLANHQCEWNAIKDAHPIGKMVFGFIVMFYPQGVIVDLGGNTIGLADYAVLSG